ncbi:protein regulator of cytokinesis 1-like [Anopheles aquasalis]|uniref:protein regulator of cytokinesis 1-like n=1 Tax=Anopheles aquasalis TaxID=42839 RepID=UPI00215B08A2|nr:protein regulator of cytokinesis 1-like [Anopheles aquasalis]
MENDVNTEEEKLETNSAQETLRVLEVRLPEVWWLWKTKFDRATFHKLLRDLPSCIDQFMEEIITATKDYAHRRRVNELQTELRQLSGQLGGISYILDPNALASLPADIQLKILEEKVESLRKEADKRKATLAMYQFKQREICRDLGRPEVNLNPSGNSLPGDRHFMAIQAYMDRLVRMLTARHSYINFMWLHCNTLAIGLKWPLHDKQKVLQKQLIAPTEENMNELKRLQGVLDGLFESATRRRKPLEVMRETGKAISLTPPVMERYRLAVECTGRSGPTIGGPVTAATAVNSTTTSTNTTITSAPAEPQPLVGGWTRLEQLWDRCLISPYERRLFRQSVKSVYPEILHLAQLDMEQVLLNYYTANAKLFELFFIWADMWNLLLNMQRLRGGNITSANGSNTTSGKRSRPRDSALVDHLAELSKETDLIENQLKAMYERYEQRFRSPFVVNGLPIHTVIATCKEKRLKFELPANCWFAAEECEAPEFYYHNGSVDMVVPGNGENDDEDDEEDEDDGHGEEEVVEEDEDEDEDEEDDDGEGEAENENADGDGNVDEEAISEEEHVAVKTTIEPSKPPVPPHPPSSSPSTATNSSETTEMVI